MKTIIPIILFAAFLLIATGLPEFGHETGEVSNYYLTHSTQETGAMNVVSAILWSYRGYDTLGEILILFTAVLAIVVQFRGDV